MRDDSTTPGSTPVDIPGGAWTVESRPYDCRCGATVRWRATRDGLVVLGPDGEPHRSRCPARGVPVLTPRDRRYLSERPSPRPTAPALSPDDRAAIDRIADALAGIPAAIDETRALGQAVARYAAQVDRRSAASPRTPPPATTTGEPRARGASVVRTSPRPGADER